MSRGEQLQKLVSISGCVQLKSQFFLDVKAVIDNVEIPEEPVLNWDPTRIQYVPVSSLAMAKEDSERVKIAGIDDKRQFTAVFSGTMAGTILSPQLIYKGKTYKSLPPVMFLRDWHITLTKNRWSNEKVMVNHLEKILFPYHEKKDKSSSKT